MHDIHNLTIRRSWNDTKLAHKWFRCRTVFEQTDQRMFWPTAERMSWTNRMQLRKQIRIYQHVMQNFSELKLKYNIANRCHDCASRLPFIANCWSWQNVSGVFEMLKRTNRLLWFIFNAETRQHWRRRHRIVRWIYKVAMQICFFSPMRKSTLNIAHLRHITDKSTHTNTHHICT